MKRNKIRYKTTIKEKKSLILSGKVYLEYIDDEAIEAPQKGDLMAYARCDALHSTRFAEYEATGFSGYFKLDVYDGKQWCLVLTQTIFPENENYFSKTERPIDTYELCAELLSGWEGKALERTYREHYAPEGAPEEE
ncbi:MAG: hypothetical protein SFT92_09130 [Rickettsiales bacterium]|nr:hypothetical protein [Rickettsiales bacterium]